MQRYFMELSFKGTHYHGWQLQPNAPSVQGNIEKSLSILLHEEIKTTGAGRTDTGVHARNFTAHFDTGHTLPEHAGDFIYKMNALLPADIAINRIFAVKPDMHARYSAVSRTYKYTISTSKDPFYPEYSWFYPVRLDLEIMNSAAASLRKADDFKSFARLHSDVKTHYCKIFEARWEEEPDKLIFTIRANRFLRNMVRSIVGTLVDIGRRKTEIENLQRIIEGRNRNLAGFSVPAHGLMLYDIEYPEGILLPLSFRRGGRG